jgi:hypothetical protein
MTRASDRPPVEAEDAVRDLIDQITVRVDDDELAAALDRIHMQSLPAATAKALTARAKVHIDHDDLRVHPRKTRVRRAITTNARLGRENLPIPLPVFAPIAVGLIVIFSGLLPDEVGLLPGFLAAVTAAAVLESGAVWWWIRRDPLRLSSREKRLVQASAARLQNYATAGPALFELRTVIVASRLVDSIRALRIWNDPRDGNVLDQHTVRLDIDVQLNAIFDHAADLADVRGALGTPEQGTGAVADAARHALGQRYQTLDEIGRALLGRVCALWTYREDLRQLQMLVDAEASLQRAESQDTAIDLLLVNAAGDELATADVGHAALDVSDIRRARTLALMQLHGDVVEFTSWNDPSR